VHEAGRINHSRFDLSLIQRQLPIRQRRNQK
jgi:hypothetical protein